MSEAWPRHIRPPSAPPQSVNPSRAPTTAEVRAMHDAPVLVMPSQSHDNPAVGMRGSIRVDPQGQVDIDLQFADMYDRPAAMQRLRLNARQVAELWASKAAYGGYAIRLDGPIPPPDTGERVIGRFGRTSAEAASPHTVSPPKPEA